MADDLYTAADERARTARRAGLQAKNTARSYMSKQFVVKTLKIEGEPISRAELSLNTRSCG